MDRNLSHVVWVGWLVLTLMLAPFAQFLGGRGGVQGLLTISFFMTACGVLPACAVARWLRWERIPLPRWLSHALAALLWSAALAVLVGMLIMGLPHGWGAMSWESFWGRCRWIAMIVVPGTVLTSLVIRYLAWLGKR